MFNCFYVNTIYIFVPQKYELDKSSGFSGQETGLRVIELIYFLQF